MIIVTLYTLTTIFSVVDMASGSSASSSVCDDTLKHFIKQQWELAGQLLEKALQQEKHIHGMQRVVRKIRAERAFLESVC